MLLQSRLINHPESLCCHSIFRWYFAIADGCWYSGMHKERNNINESAHLDCRSVTYMYKYTATVWVHGIGSVVKSGAYRRALNIVDGSDQMSEPTVAETGHTKLENIIYYSNTSLVLRVSANWASLQFHCIPIWKTIGYSLVFSRAR